jgi:hypothetical protein
MYFSRPKSSAGEACRQDKIWKECAAKDALKSSRGPREALTSKNTNEM